MRGDSLPLLVNVFWQGFSLTFFLTVLVQWVRPEFDQRVVFNDLPDSRKRVLPASRIGMGLISLAGTYGVAAFLGTFREQLPASADAVFVIGLTVGIWIATVVLKRIVAYDRAQLKKSLSESASTSKTAEPRADTEK